ncbi:MAG: hypothetical protein HPZ91_11005 [Lentisphaeria bacterium]|nr:hypothetical protein [Lentisphaeria bacterium]
MRVLNYTMPAAALLAGVLLPGCTTTEEHPLPPIVRMSESDRDEGARKVAEDYMANFAAAFRDRDIEKFRKVISPEKQKQLTPEKFQEVLDAAAREQGELVNMELVTMLDQIIFQSYVWKMTYEKKDSEGKPMRRDFLYYVRVGKVGDGQYSIGASGFRL